MGASPNGKKGSLTSVNASCHICARWIQAQCWFRRAMHRWTPHNWPNFLRCHRDADSRSLCSPDHRLAVVSCADPLAVVGVRRVLAERARQAPCDEAVCIGRQAWGAGGQRHPIPGPSLLAGACTRLQPAGAVSSSSRQPRGRWLMAVTAFTPGGSEAGRRRSSGRHAAYQHDHGRLGQVEVSWVES